MYINRFSLDAQLNFYDMIQFELWNHFKGFQGGLLDVFLQLKA